VTMEFLVIWLLFGVVCAILANNKGHSGCLWFGLGVLLGPIGLIIVLIIPKNESKVKKTAITSGRMKECPYCGELVAVGAIKCNHCTSDLRGQNNRMSRVNQSGSSPRFCPNCGYDFSSAEIGRVYYCSKCGMKLR